MTKRYVRIAGHGKYIYDDESTFSDGTPFTAIETDGQIAAEGMSFSGLVGATPAETNVAYAAADPPTDVEFNALVDAYNYCAVLVNAMLGILGGSVGGP